MTNLTAPQTALALAIAILREDMRAMVDCHAHPSTGVIPPDEPEARAAFDRYCAAINGLEAMAASHARPLCEWHEDMGPALWWRFPVNEAPWCGQPIDDDWPHYHTHFTPLVVPAAPAVEVVHG